ncbi:MAG: hypothetical protein HN580_09710 [Deltaproteobacteria bacterium]|jgi:hypothetical protein|nr:hypothetical protein [Deltaproteobacteria bacterium]MBT4263817.1 hypothetical protein [Deltaproteobacteria bacterium]MBT4640502.1 hypothetical protein [Deltaproteobacteria bacterium]MBT6502262.1 hypothetical protein [Deltaproteobacteria bacterium]MBT7153743.1 hypothetical protein [Deltaproteobacteria bacterium]
MKCHTHLALLLGIIILGFSPDRILAEDKDLYSFDAKEFTKKTWEWKGETSAAATVKELNTDSVLYPVKFPNEDHDQSNEFNLQVILESRWDWEWSRLFLAGEANLQRSSLEELDDEYMLLREGYWQISTLDPHNIEIGKRLLRWGKGYAFNPVAFLERVKNPEDPEASREGLWIIQGIWIPGGFSVFSNSSVSLVYLPVRDELNDDYLSAQKEENFWGLKVYALIGTTDIDLYYVQKNEQGEVDWGFDFSANITSNFEVHGEYAANNTDESRARTTLLGLRYLTENDVTWIVEGFHDSSGLTDSESKALFELIKSSTTLVAKKILSQIQQSNTLNRDYGYVKASVKEPFNWLYFTPSVAWLINMNDSSTNVNTQLAYSPSDNWVFQLSWQHLAGGTYTQYGENVLANKFALDANYSF